MEAEERLKRRALEVCQDHIRNVMEIARKIPQMLDIFVKDDIESARALFAETREMEENVAKTRRTVSQELTEIGAILISREDYLRFTNLASEIADLTVGIIFRLLVIMERGWAVPPDVKNGIIELSDAVFLTISKLRETMITLNYDPSKTIEKASEVEAAEHVVDDLYRALQIKILRSKMEIPVLLLSRDIVELLEGAADKAEDSSDAARVLALTI
jgi:uncharacterized protein Yka (UPF0111/DUF47 family)